MKFALSKIKNYLQGIKSGVDEAENQINDLNIKKQKTTNHNKKKKKEKKDSVRSL